jgi:hypothetical protein
MFTMTRAIKIRIVDLKLGFGAKPKGNELVLYNNGDKEDAVHPKNRKRESRK